MFLVRGGAWAGSGPSSHPVSTRAGLHGFIWTGVGAEAVQGSCLGGRPAGQACLWYWSLGALGGYPGSEFPLHSCIMTCGSPGRFCLCGSLPQKVFKNIFYNNVGIKISTIQTEFIMYYLYIFSSIKNQNMFVGS